MLIKDVSLPHKEGRFYNYFLSVNLSQHQILEIPGYRDNCKLNDCGNDGDDDGDDGFISDNLLMYSGCCLNVNEVNRFYWLSDFSADIKAFTDVRSIPR